MLRGDLCDASPDRLLTELANQQVTGCLVVEAPASRGSATTEPTARDAQIYLRAGKVYAAALAGGTFLVGTRLTTSYALGPTELEEALEAQRAELHGWRLGEILVHLGHVDATAVDSISLEQVLEIVTEVCTWHTGAWRFRTGDRTRAMLTQPVTVPELLRRADERQREWSGLAATLGGDDAPLMTTGTTPADAPLELTTLLTVAAAHGDLGLRVCSHAAGLSLLEGARLAVVARAAGALAERPALDVAVGGGMTVVSSVATVGTSGATAAPRRSLAPRPVAGPTSAALQALLALPGSAGVQAGVAMLLATGIAPPEQVATVLDLTAARAARSGEHAAAENAAHVAALEPTRPQGSTTVSTEEVSAEEVSAEEVLADLARQAEPTATTRQVNDDEAAALVAELAAAELAAAEQAAAAAERLAVEQAAADHAAAEQAAREAEAREAEAREQAARQIVAEQALEQAERERQSRLVPPPVADNDDAEALELAAALRAAQGSVGHHRPPAPAAPPAQTAAAQTAAAQTAPAKMRPAAPVSAFTAPAPTPATPAAPAPSTPPAFGTDRPDDAPAASATWGQGYLASSPPAGLFGSRDPQADTASLMRELTSLGFSEEENEAVTRAATFRNSKPAPAPAPPAAPTAPAPSEKKRRGFFGR